MNPYQVVGIIAGCTLICAGVVSVLAMQGVPLLLAFLSVYLIAVWIMIGMQKRAREYYHGDEISERRQYGRDSTARRVRIDDPAESENEEEVLTNKQLHA